MTTPLQAQAEISSLLEKLRIGQKYDRASGDPLDMSNTMEEAVDCIESLLAALSAHEAEVGRLRKDAERYQWLREHCDSMSLNPPLTVAKVTGWGLEGWSGDDLNSAIDAALIQGETN